MIADRIKDLRHKHNMSQTMLAKKLNKTRSAVNAWEMGISVPSTQCVIELSRLFKVPTDYILGVNDDITVNITDLSDEEKEIVFCLLNYFNNHNK